MSSIQVFTQAPQDEFGHGYSVVVGVCYVVVLEGWGHDSCYEIPVGVVFWWLELLGHFEMLGLMCVHGEGSSHGFRYAFAQVEVGYCCTHSWGRCGGYVAAQVQVLHG